MRDFQLPGRSTVHALNGMAATSQPLATLAAIGMLQRGGNAVDAAITASAVLGVVEPQSTGIGGDCFALLVPGGEGKVVALNGSGRAPAAATPDWYAGRGITAIDRFSPHAVTVPGAVDAWARLLQDHGTRDFEEVLAPAIRYAEEGYVVAPRVARDWAVEAKSLAGDENARRIFLPGGKPPAAGEVHRQPELAATLRLIAKQGRAGFYEGAVAEEIVDYLRLKGGLHSLDDFADNAPEYVTPIQTSYGGLDVHQIPPNGQGIAVLIMLNILAGFDLSAMDPLGARRLHLEAEAKRLAFHVRDTLVGDPSQVAVPVEEILSAGYAERLRRSISEDMAMGLNALDQVPTHPDTVYLCVVDRDRNVVSFINSIFDGFGSGLVTPKSGILLHSRGTGFVLTEGHPNCIGPGKRPLHTIIPGLAMQGGRAVMPYGVMGAQFQPTGQVHLLTNILDYGMDLQEALDCPRAFHDGEVLGIENGISDRTADELRARGHEVVRLKEPLGGGQAIWIDWEKGTLTGASEPRKDGCALGY
ncbi:MAG: gamma-glutamyltransferase [Proteobacteria bacterium]|nr:gamma-glutamyltransferase [Pseudomonadota bacterium]